MVRSVVEPPGHEAGDGALGEVSDGGDALGIEDGDEVVFRVEGSRAVLAKVPNFLDLAGTVPAPAAKRNVAWDQVIRRTKSARAAARR